MPDTVALDPSKINYLRKEIVPFGGYGYAVTGLPIVDNPDPVLRYMAQKDEAAYRTIEMDPIIASAKNHRVNTLLAAGSQVVASESGTADAKMYHEFTIALLKRIPRFTDLQRKIMDAMFWGWRPIERLWEPFVWQGQVRWGIAYTYEKMPEHFRFTTDRNLVYVSPDLRGFEIYDLEKIENRMRWLTPSYGSLNNPYGEGIDQVAWIWWYTKNRFVEMWSRGLNRSMGVLNVKEAGGGGNNWSMGPTTGNKGVTAKEAMSAVISELTVISDMLNKNGMLVQRAGWDVSMLSDVRFSDGWLGAIEYIDGILRTYVATESLSWNEAQFGTRAQSQTHRDVGVNDTGRVDAKWLESVINDQLIAVALEANFGQIDLDDMPKWRSRLSKAIDAQGLQFMFDAGAALDGDALATEWNVPLAGKDTKNVLQKSQGPTPAQLSAALTAAPARDPSLDPNGPDNVGDPATDPAAN